MLANILGYALFIVGVGMGLGQNFPARGQFGSGPAQSKLVGPWAGPNPNPFLRDGFGPKVTGPRLIWAGPGPNPSLSGCGSSS